jgi:hypothetical protein
MDNYIASYIDPSGQTPAQISDLEVVFALVVRSALGFAGIAVFIMLLVGGFKYLTSAGNPKATEAASKTITYAIAGLVLVALSYLILLIIHTITGAEILNFRVSYW